MNGYDARYREWAARQGPAVGDLGWRLAHLPWRQRMLLSRYSVRGSGCSTMAAATGSSPRVGAPGCEGRWLRHLPAAIAQAAHFQAGMPGWKSPPSSRRRPGSIWCSVPRYWSTPRMIVLRRAGDGTRLRAGGPAGGDDAGRPGLLGSGPQARLRSRASAPSSPRSGRAYHPPALSHPAPQPASLAAR